MNGVLVPREPSQMTADWLTAALDPKYPGAVVESLHIGTVIQGTATKVRLMLTYNEAGHNHRLPPTMWFKGGLEAHSDDPVLLAVYEGEANFYMKFADELQMNIPKCFCAHIDHESRWSFLLLEDLLARNASFGYATNPATPSQAAALVDQLAKTHGRYWGSAEIASDETLQNGGPVIQSLFDLFTPEKWRRCMALPRGEFVSGELDDFERLTGGILKLLKNNMAKANCLVHGDAHHGNTFYTPDGKGSFIDWQGPAHNVWAHDFSYYIITALSVEDRRHNERDLVQHYVKSIGQYGVELTFDEAWITHRRNAIYSCSWAMCLPEWQPEEVCYLNAERACTAALDLDTFSVQ